MSAFLVGLGSAALAFSLLLAAYGAVMGFLAASSRSANLIASAVRSMRGTLLLVAVSCIGIWAAFLGNHFEVEYVFMYASRDLPLAYKLAALWGGQKGSLMLWALLLAIFAVAVVRPAAYKDPGERRMVVGAGSVLMAILVFFLILANFSTDPFERLPEFPPDGRGLNPLLQNPAMAIHPPVLYAGFVGMSVPFAFLIASLWLGRKDDRWLRISRKPGMIAWTALFAGNMLGMAWAYVELGWGGYWAWDPVENAALMPLLTGTAFIHSVMIQERRGMLKVWNALLICLTFLLTIFGTFLTRSGVISSVHSFGSSTLGTYFLVFLGVCTVFSALTILVNRRLLATEHRLDSLLSREAFFLLNNLILVGAAFSVFWGTIYPVISEAVTGMKETVGAPFFNSINIPIAIVLLLLTGIGPLIAWRRSSSKQLWQSFSIPLLVALVPALLIPLYGARNLFATLIFSGAAFVVATIVLELYRGVRVRRMKQAEAVPVALVRLFQRNPRRYGGYVVHLGIIFFFVGIAASSAYRKQAEALLKVGETLAIGPYQVRLTGIDPIERPNATGIRTRFDLSKSGSLIATLAPEKLLYQTGLKEEMQPTTNVAIRSTLARDIYLVPAGWFPEESQVHLKAYLNPMVSWIWIGGALVVLGAALALIPVKTPLTRTDADPHKKTKRKRAQRKVRTKQ